MSNIDKRSKYLALILRHKPEEVGVVVEDNGWVDVKTLIKNSDFTLSELKEIVSTDSKGRYSFNSDFSKIRANQGHSINVKIEFKEFVPKTVLYHGTAKKFVDSIYKKGICKMNRQFVHLSSNIDTAIKVGNRHGECIVFEIDAVSMFNVA